MKRFLATVAIFAALGVLGLARAADLPIGAPPPFIPAVPPVLSWAACYVGVNGGGKWFSTTSQSVDIPRAIGPAINTPASSLAIPDATASSGIVGGQFGCNYQMGHVVFGFETDADWQHMSNSFAVTPSAARVPFVPGDSFTVTNNWQGSFRGRLGYAWDRVLFYATGGLAYTGVTFATNFIPVGIFPATVVSDRKTLYGFTLGGGVEYSFTRYLSFAIEGRYNWYGSQTFDSGVLATGAGIVGSSLAFTTTPVTSTLKLNTAEVTARLNWRFNWGSVY